MNISKITSVFMASVIALSASLFTFSHTYTGDNTYTASAVSSTNILVDEFMSLLNAERTALGLEPLAIDPYISNVAQIRAEEQLQQTGHTRPDGTKWSTVIDRDILAYTSGGENVLRGTSVGNAKKALEIWKSSEGHWENITDPDFRYTGVGIVYDPNSEFGWYWVQIFSDKPSTGYTPEPVLDSVIYGDINGDNKVDVFDYIDLMSYIRYTGDNVPLLRSEIHFDATGYFSETQFEAADCFKDGMITEADAKIMMRYILGDMEVLPVEFE